MNRRKFLSASGAADLVFLKRNPLESMEHMQDVEAVLQSGRLVHSLPAIKETG